MKYRLNNAVLSTSAPPIPLTSLWAATYSPVASTSAEPYTALINLAQGIPGSFPPQEFLNKLGEEGSKGVNCGYGDGYGEMVLRKAIVEDIHDSYGIREKKGKGEFARGEGVRVEDCCITSGANAAFYHAIVTLAGAGDEIILTDPFYFNHYMTLTQLSINPIALPTPSPTFLPSPSTFRTLLTPRTKALILVSPNNPTGAIYPPELIGELGEICKEWGIVLVLDETYREFGGEGEDEEGMGTRLHGVFGKEDWRDWFIHISSFSKSYAIPSHRLAVLLASPSFLLELSKVIDSASINSNRAAQKATAWAVEGIKDWRKEMRREILSRGVELERLLEGGGWEVGMRGGYYAWIRHPFPQIPSRTIAEQIANHVGLIVLPGSFFSFPLDTQERKDEDRYLRFSIANVSSLILSHVPARLKRFEEIWNDLPSLERVSLTSSLELELEKNEERRIDGC